MLGGVVRQLKNMPVAQGPEGWGALVSHRKPSDKFSARIMMVRYGQGLGRVVKEDK
jgi:hypothetical protein